MMHGKTHGVVGHGKTHGCHLSQYPWLLPWNHGKGHYMAKPNAELLHPNADSNLQHRFAEEFDVYVHKDTDALSSLCVEIDTGQTPGIQSKIRKLQQQIWQLQISARSGRKVYV